MKKYEIDMTTGPLFGKIVRFSLPLMATGILQLLFNAIDTVVVGRFVGDAALAAVGTTASLINLIIGLFIGVSVGSNVLVAQYFGAKRKKDVEEVVHTSILVGIISGVALAALGFFLARTFLTWMNVPEEDDVLNLATRYLRIYFLGCPLMMVYNFCSAILRAVGDTKRPLLFLLIGGVLNLGLNLLLVVVFHMSVEGVAIPTVATQGVSMILAMIVMIKDKGYLHFSFRKLRIVKDKLLKLLKIGIPSGIQGCVFSLSNVTIVSSVNYFGKFAMAGNTAATNIEGFVYQAMHSFHHTALCFTAQNHGAGERKRILRSGLICCGSVAVVGIVLAGIVYLSGPYLVSIYTSTPQAIDAAMTKLLFVCVPYFTCGLMDVLCGMVKGLGASFTPMITSLLGCCALRIAWVYTVFQANRSLETLYTVYPISWTITAVVHLICFIILFRRLGKRQAQFKEAQAATKKTREAVDTENH